MAEERLGTREFDFRKALSWTQLLRTFLVALDPFKLAVAAVGLLTMALGWSFISVLFFNLTTEYRADDFKPQPDATPADISALQRDQVQSERRYEMMKQMAGPGGRYRIMPWFEDRGPNPFFLIRDLVKSNPDERRELLSWFVTNQMPILIEPLRKFFSPVLAMFDSRGNWWTRTYCVTLLVWFLAVWGFFGGIITRMAILQLAGKEGGGLRESVKFVMNRFVSYLISPLVPIGLILAVVVGCIVFGLFHMIPIFGDIIVDGLFWWVILGAGLVMALLFVGLIGYPLMYTTLSAEGSDTFDALSRSYNYVFEAPWNYLWYSIVAVAYGAILIFVVVFMSSLMVYMGKWGVSQTPWSDYANRSPEYLFVYAPTSFEWREVMLENSPIGTQAEKANPEAAKQYREEFAWYNYVGAAMVSFWLTILFLVMLGFTYSYFWTAASMIYLLMRKKVDETEIDEVYIEEEEPEEPISAPKLASTLVTPSTPSNTQMVEPPALKVTPPVTTTPEPTPPVTSTPTSTPTTSTPITSTMPSTTELKVPPSSIEEKKPDDNSK